MIVFIFWMTVLDEMLADVADEYWTAEYERARKKIAQRGGGKS